MSHKSDAADRGAREAADYLESLGQHKRAEDIRAACRSLASARATLKTLHRDNMEIRAQLAGRE